MAISGGFYLAAWLVAILLGGQENALSEPLNAAASEVATASAPETVAVQPAKNLLDDAELLQKAKTDLQSLPEFHGKPLRVYNKVDFFNGTRPRIEVSLENPNMPNALVFYTFERGKWTQGEAEDVSHIKNLPRHFVPLADVDFAQVPQIANIWRKKAAEVQAVEREPYHVAFIWLPARNKRFWHTATLEAVKKQFYLSVNLDGTVWEFNGLSGSTVSEEN